jgi:hypothetical protein
METIGQRYKPLHKLGQGGGTYLAEDQHCHEDPCAVKYSKDQGA